MSKEKAFPKFFYGAKVKITNGFYRGQKGVVTRCYYHQGSGNAYSYDVEFGRLWWKQETEVREEWLEGR